jgi:polyhydroxyalkanoate synthase
MKKDEDALNEQMSFFLGKAKDFVDDFSKYFVHEMSVIPARVKHTTWMDMFPSYRFEILMDPEELPATGLTKSETVYEEGHVVLKRCITEDKITKKTPILFIYALINKPYILDLRPGNSIVEFFKKEGYDVYVIDWGLPVPEDKFITFDYYIDGYINSCVDTVREISKTDSINIFGWCMGANFAAIYAPLYPEKVKNLATLTLPMDANSGGLLSLWASDEVFHLDKVISLYGNMPAKLIRYSVISIYPFREMRKNVNFYSNMENKAFVEAYSLAEKWLNDNIDIPGLVFKKYIRDIFQTTNLLDGKMVIGDRCVDLKNIKCPLLNLAAEEDNLVPIASSKALNEHVSSKDNEFVVLPGGHVSFAYDPKAQQYWKKTSDWFSQRD